MTHRNRPLQKVVISTGAHSAKWRNPLLSLDRIPQKKRIVILSGAQSAQSKDLRLLLHPGLSSAPADVISLCEISFGSSNNKIRLIHLNLNLVILVGSLRARSIERNLVWKISNGSFVPASDGSPANLKG